MSKMDQYQELKEMVRCVQLYYRQQQQQREIAQRLAITPSRVSRLLKRASEEGLFKVEFNFPQLFEAAANLMERFRLLDAVVIPTGEPSELKEDLGTAGARYFEKVTRLGARVGLSCGNTLFYLIKHLEEGLLKRLHIYPLVAESTLKSVDLLPNTLVGMMTAKYRPDAVGYALPAQFIRGPRGASPGRDAFLDQPEIRQIYEEAQHVDVALVGIGGLNPTSPGFSARADEEGITIKHLMRAGAVGEFNYQPFDAAGNLLTSREINPILETFVGVSIGRLKQLSQEHGKFVIGIGGGSEKVPAVRAALAGQMCNVLITDSETAAALM